MRRIVVLISILTSVCSSELLDNQKQKTICPPWFTWVNSSGYCLCGMELPSRIVCNQKKQVFSLFQGSCIFHDSEESTTVVAWCPFMYPENAMKDGLIPLPANVSKLNRVVCGILNREVKGPLCGRCTNGTGPFVYSVGSTCVPCSPINILYYILLQYVPTTVIFLLVIIFRLKINSAPMANYVLFCNSSVLYIRCTLWLYYQRSVINAFIAKSALTLSAVWSFNALLFISPPLCISQNLEDIYIHTLP